MSEKDEWEEIISRIPADIDLEKSAKEAGALQRRREIRRASELLQVILVYAVCDWSLRLVGIWCEVMGIGSLSAVAIRKRLRGSRKWLGMLIGVMLQAEVNSAWM